MLENNSEYFELLDDIKKQINESRVKAFIKVNSEQILMYYRIGKKLIENNKWGSGFIDSLAKDLRISFPKLKGLSSRNLRYMQKMARTYDEEFLQGVLAKLSWYHNITLLDKIKDEATRKWYAIESLENGWSQSVLLNQIGTSLHIRQGENQHKTTNYIEKLPSPNSENVLNMFKDPYVFDMIDFEKNLVEREVEQILVDSISKLLLELGKGFAFLGRQYHMSIGDDDFYVDLLFYNVVLKCYIVIELKSNKFIPEYIGKLNFYVSAVDKTLKTETDNPTIGILLCKDKNKLIAEFALNNVDSPIGIAEYKYIKELPQYLNDVMPSIEELEKRINILEEDEKL